MASFSVVPNGDGSVGGWAATSGTNASCVDEAWGSPDDADYTQILFSASGASIFLLLGDMPADFGTALTVTVDIRCNHTVSKAGFIELDTIQLVQSDETTAITSTQTVDDTTTIANFSLTLTITGGTSKTVWDGARLKITASAGATVGGVRVYTVRVTGTYTATAGNPWYAYAQQ